MSKESIDILKHPHKNKIYRGAYSYLRSNNVYSEETFEVYKDKKELGLNFYAEIHSRVSTGELLTINVMYVINKNYIPQLAVIKRSLGKDNSEEVFEFKTKKNILYYKFKNDEGTEERELTTPPKFHVSTPCACTSMLFLRSKKFDATGKNFYSVYQSNNKWNFEEEPSIKTLSLTKLSTTTESINIDGHNVQAIQYRVTEYDDNEDAQGEAPPSIKVYTSQHATIPYTIRSEDNTKIQIKYFNNLMEEA